MAFKRLEQGATKTLKRGAWKRETKRKQISKPDWSLLAAPLW